MKTVILVSILAILTGCASVDNAAKAVGVVDVRDFGAIPDDGRNDADALRKAVKACRETNAQTLLIPPGRYLLADDEAIRIQNDAMHKKFGNNPRNHLFNRKHKHVIGLDFKAIKNLTINANDAELLCDGWMEPISLVDTENITINGLTIDYKRPPNSAGKIIALGKGTVDVKFFDWCPVFEGINFCRFIPFDDDSQSYFGSVYGKSGKLIGPNTMRLYLGRSQLKVGRVLVGLHSFHTRPAILIYRCKNTVLNGVSIHAQPGMGVVGHMSENITMDRLKIIPRKGRYASSNTDATHFVSCYGFINFNKCEFGGQGDDSTNIHNYYTDILSKPVNNKCKMGVGLSYTHSVRMDYPRIGDKFAVVLKRTLQEVDYVTVKSIAIDLDAWTYVIEYEGDIPEDYKNYYLANITALPSFKFINCRIKSHRARSVLCKTRNVLIEGNIFERCTGTAVHIGAEGGWKEGSTAKDVIIRNNTFLHCGTGGRNEGVRDNASAIAINVGAPDRTIPGMHKRILIENNDITGGHHAIAVKNAEDVTVRNNIFRGIRNKPVITGASKNIKIYDNQSK